MNKYWKAAVWCVVMLLVVSPVFAQAEGEGTSTPSPTGTQVAGTPTGSPGMLIFEGAAAIGSGLVIIGAGYGIGKIGASTVESMARQPEMASNMQTAMIISAALIEGATFFGLIVCFLAIK